MKKVIKVFFKILFFLLLIAIAIGLIYLGLYYSDISKKTYPVGLVIDEIFDKAEEITSIHSDYLLGDRFEAEGSLKMTLSSEEVAQKAATDPEYAKKNRMLKNLSSMNTVYKFQHDAKDKKAYFETTEKIGEEEIFSGKYLITNSTDYYFVNKILKNYVNGGGNTYFESFTEETTSLDNLSYLYRFLADSIKNHITEEDLDGDDTETLIGEDTVKVGRISYRIDDKTYKNLLKGILKDLKNDARASQIISLVAPDFQDWKVNEKKTYIKKNESYTVYIYVSKWLFTPLKVEVMHIEGDNKESYSFEGDKSKGTFYYSVNNEMKYSASYESTSKKLDITVFDRFYKEIGTIKGEKDKNNLLFTMTLELDGEKYDVNFSSKHKDLKENTYTREDALIFKISNQKVVRAEGNLLLVSEIRGTTKIDEDVSSSVLESTLTEEEKTQMDNLQNKIKERLEK